MSDERLWFDQAIEGLWLRALGGRVTPALRASLKDAGLDLDRLLPGYPAATVARCVKLTAAALFPGQPEDDALREVGRLFLTGYQQTLIGRAVLQVLKLIGPRRSLQRMQTNFRSVNYVKTRFTELGPTRAEVWFNHVDGMPAYFAGIIEQGGVLSGAKAVTVTWQEKDGGGAFLVEWTQ